ncbi:suppressor of SWI4 1 homolog [Anneissia japonica]|uniref:suppressor of SWI4 1 homolog n=1 Tax=Anneissia japonica TaxID=1529436 RepID=UPI00142579F9|nr:suppressor of SWI4 1 homolog [Anneissia japonica]XP_033098989.1 suppressor of SWI4 1 homolog [Anneissia japonica]
MARKKQGRSKKKSKIMKVTNQESSVKGPHTFVFQRGTVGKNVQQLVLDTRRIMEPFTSTGLRARKKNVLKDFISVAGPLGVSHLLTFSKTQTSVNMRIIRLPKGPTITFKVKQYCLIRDVVSQLKRPNMYASQFRHPPLLVLNNFNSDSMHMKLMATMFQNMFPSINVHTVKLNTIRRCVLLNYDPNTNLIELRHYSIKVVPAGMSRSVKKLLQTKVPNLSRYTDVSEYFTNAGNLSESEAEQDGPHNEVNLPQSIGSRGNMTAEKSAIRLVEIGPRIQLQLVKIEEGVCNGDIIYHQFVKKTEEEIAAAKTAREKKKLLKDKRKNKQKMNVLQKKELREKHKEKSILGMQKKKEQEEKQDSDADSIEAVSMTKVDDAGGDEEDDEDDAEYYRREVGQEPEQGLFQKRTQMGLKRKKQDESAPKSSIKRFKSQRKKTAPANKRDKRSIGMPSSNTQRTGFKVKRSNSSKKSFKFRKTKGGR